MLYAKDTISDLFCSNNEFQAELTEISPDGNIRIWYTLKRVDYYYYEDLLSSCFIFLEIFFGIMGLSFFSLWIDNQDTLGRYK